MTDEERYRFEALQYALSRLPPHGTTILENADWIDWKDYTELGVQAHIVSMFARHFPGVIQKGLGYYHEISPINNWNVGRYRNKYRLTMFGKELQNHLKSDPESVLLVLKTWLSAGS